jgi:hypothetical protein
MCSARALVLLFSVFLFSVFIAGATQAQDGNARGIFTGATSAR